MKLFRLPIKATLPLTPTLIVVTICSPMYQRWIKIEQNSEIRHMALSRQQGKVFDQFDTDTSRSPLISNTGIKAAISDHQCPCLQRW